MGYDKEKVTREQGEVVGSELRLRVSLNLNKYNKQRPCCPDCKSAYWSHGKSCKVSLSGREVKVGFLSGSHFWHSENFEVGSFSV